MLGSAVIEVMIGLIFVYILLSLLVMQINQIIANAFKIRAHTLRERVEALIFDNQLQERVLSHPVVGFCAPRSRTKRPRTAASVPPPSLIYRPTPSPKRSLTSSKTPS